MAALNDSTKPKGDYMKSRTLMCITAMTLFAALVIPVRLTAQEQPASQQDKKEHRYKLVDLGTFGGPVGYLNWPGAQVLRNRGAIAGAADTSTPDPKLSKHQPLAS